MDNQKNLLLAVVLSLIILIGYDFIFAPDEPIRQNTEEQIIEPEVLKDDIPSISSTETIESSKSKQKENRIKFKSGRLEGSLNLYGSTFDDLILSDYFETINREKNSSFKKRKYDFSLFFKNGLGIY